MFQSSKWKFEFTGPINTNSIKSYTSLFRNGTNLKQFCQFFLQRELPLLFIHFQKTKVKACVDSLLPEILYT
jgi:hypothetical protein